MTDAELDEIETRAAGEYWTKSPMHRSTCLDDVPRLVAEVRRLRALSLVYIEENGQLKGRAAALQQSVEQLTGASRPKANNAQEA